MSTTSVGAASSVDPLVKQLVERIDRNQDGQISTTEFGEFLTSLLKAHDTGGTSTPRAATLLTRLTDSPPSDGASDPVVPEPWEDRVPPSTWTDNNAPYGVTFAGFSPQNHTHLTLDDLGIPGKAEKYAVYHYLLANRVQPTGDWAPSAAEALNRKYNTNVFHAIDGETLGYGSEYVHSAPNGYGMARGTYNPNATGEFFWGTTDA